MTTEDEQKKKDEQTLVLCFLAASAVLTIISGDEAKPAYKKIETLLEAIKQ